MHMCVCMHACVCVCVSMYVRMLAMVSALYTLDSISKVLPHHPVTKIIQSTGLWSFQ